MNGLATGCFLDSHIHTVLGLQGQVVHSTVLGWHKTTQGVAILVVNGSTCCQNACITHHYFHTSLYKAATFLWC